jgi:hypothetical protein
MRIKLTTGKSALAGQWLEIFLDTKGIDIIDSASNELKPGKQIGEFPGIC